MNNKFSNTILNISDIRHLRGVLYLFCCLFFVTCQSKEKPVSFIQNLPSHFPETPTIPDNPINPNTVAFGKKLFFEKALSIDSTISCASCHLPNFAFSDTVALSLGVRDSIGKRNSPSLINVTYQKRLFRDGGTGSLEKQAITPIEAAHEMAFNLKQLALRLEKNAIYQQLSEAAYQRSISPYTIVRGLAAYQRTLISGNSPYDLFIYKKDKTALTLSQQNGMKLFFSERTNCFQCHNDFLLTNQIFENNGLYEIYADIGRAGVSLKQEDKGKFKVPSLRNVAITAPYMHDGSLKTLEDVIEHYNSGGKNHKDKSEFIQPLSLTEEEQESLKAFLESLTDLSVFN